MKLFREMYPGMVYNIVPAHACASKTAGRTRNWIVDSGSCFDLVGLDELKHEETANIQTNTSPVTLTTANGVTTTDKRVKLSMKEMVGAISAIVLPDAPAVLSLGRKCLDEGYSFMWK